MTVGSMLRVLLFSLALLSITGEALAVTVSWDCNLEADMKAYRAAVARSSTKRTAWSCGADSKRSRQLARYPGTKTPPGG